MGWVRNSSAKERADWLNDLIGWIINQHFKQIWSLVAWDSVQAHPQPKTTAEKRTAASEAVK
jgi:hypothetical protein